MAATLEQKRKNFFMSEFHLHRYIERDATLATIVANDYFKGTNIGLEVGDLVLVTGSDGTAFYNVKKYDRTGVQLEKVTLKAD